MAKDLHSFLWIINLLERTIGASRGLAARGGPLLGEPIYRFSPYKNTGL